MSDVMPNYTLEAKKIDVQIGQQNQNKLATELRIMQLEVDLAAANRNMDVIDEAVAALEAQKASLTEGIENHG